MQAKDGVAKAIQRVQGGGLSLRKEIYEFFDTLLVLAQQCGAAEKAVEMTVDRERRIPHSAYNHGISG